MKEYLKKIRAEIKRFNQDETGMASFAPTAMGLGGGILASWALPFLGPLAFPIGFIGGSLLGTMLFPMKQKHIAPKVGGYPVQTGQVGVPIPVVYGTTRLAGNIIWMGELHPYVVKHSSGGGGGSGGGGESTTEETRYRRSFLIGICEGHSSVRRLWKGKKLIPVTDATYYDGHNNSGISTLIGEDYAEYKNMLVAYFDEYELGNIQTIPNFVFEVGGYPYNLRYMVLGGVNYFDIIYGVDGVALDAGGVARDAGGGNTGLPVSAHPFDAGDEVIIQGTTNYDSDLVATVQSETQDEIVVNKAYSAETFDGTERLTHRITHGDTTTGRHCTDGLGNIYLCGDENLTTDSTCLLKFDKDFNEVSNFFEKPGGAFEASEKGGVVLLSTDAKYLYLRTHRNIGFWGRVYKYDISDGSLLQDSGWLASTNAGGMIIDRLDNDLLYVPGFGNGTVPASGYSCPATVSPSDLTIETQFSDFLACRDIHLAHYIIPLPDGTTEDVTIVIGAINHTAPSPWLDCSIHTRAVEGAESDLKKLSFTQAAGAVFQIEVWKDETGVDKIYCVHNTNANGQQVTKVGLEWDISVDSITGEFIIDYVISVEASIALDYFPAFISKRWDNKIMSFANSNVVATYDLITVMDMDLVYVDTYTNLGKIGWTFLSLSGEGFSMPILSQDGQRDENCASIIQDLLQNTRYGAGIPNDDIDLDSFDAVRNYCFEEGYMISLAITEQRSVFDWIDYICSHFRGYIYWNEGKLGLGVFKDESSAFTLTQEDLVLEEGEEPEPPVKTKKRDYSDTVNRIEVAWMDREKDYAPGMAIENDEIDQRISGQVRKLTINLAGITNPDYAQKMATLLLVEGMYRFTVYNFTVTYKNMLLEIGDVGTLSDGDKIASESIRIIGVSEDKDGSGINIQAVEDISGYYPVITRTTQRTEHEPDDEITLADGTVNFREDINERVAYLSISPGNAQANGWYVYLSFDDVSYQYLGRALIDGVTSGDANSVGTLVGNLPSAKVVTHRIKESFVVSIGTVTDIDTAITDEEFLGNMKLCKIDDEIIGYYDAEETATQGIWKISNLIRGLYGTVPTAHMAGATFATLDVNFLQIFREEDIGKTVYIKVLTFYADEVQDIADVSGFSYTIQGYGERPASVTLMRLLEETKKMEDEYEGDALTLYWNLASKTTGFNRGGFDVHPDATRWYDGDDESLLVNSNGVLYSSYIADDEIQAIDFQAEEEDGTAISSQVLSASAESLALSKATDLGGNSPAVLKLTPRRALPCRRTEEITVTQK